MVRYSLSLLLGIPPVFAVLYKLPMERSHMTAVDHTVVTFTNYIGDASFALTGTLAAGTEGMDVIGCNIVGTVTALGGGTLRDIALGRLPVFWAKDFDELLLCGVVCTFTFFLWRRLSVGWGLSVDDEWVFWTDTVGLGVFAAMGAKTAGETSGVHHGSCVVAGLFTATFGGLTRDVLCRRPPRILYATQEIYALPALAGALVTTLIMRYGGPSWSMEAVLVGAWVTIEMRVIAVNMGLRTPSFPKELIFKTVQDLMPSSDNDPLPSYQLTAAQEILRDKLYQPLVWNEESVP